ncbi:DDE-type integrase/transposase/recombinase [Streptomyces sp. NRRL S-448]|uniref:DDE-type integrase/transposase/recombinase n=1 Tax=Streptomyces sp. NRRL S-448 TaxID=1463907 RepID=UPI003563BA1D
MPNRTSAADFTHVAAWAGTAYVAFVVDACSRRIVGWSAATTGHARAALHRDGRRCRLRRLGVHVRDLHGGPGQGRARWPGRYGR